MQYGQDSDFKIHISLHTALSAWPTLLVGQPILAILLPTLH
jgi:hypothetical protein